MDSSSAMRRAWAFWLVTVMISAAATAIAMALTYPGGAERDPRPTTSPGLLLNMVVFAVVIPVGFIIHWWCYRRYWKEGLVQPRGYLLANQILWSAMGLTVLTLAISCLVQRVFMPDMLLTFVAVILLLMSWPGGWPMIHPMRRSEEDDDEALHLPRDPGQE